MTDEHAAAVGMSLVELVEEGTIPWDESADKLTCKFEHAARTWAAGEPIRVAATPTEVAVLLEALDGNARLLDSADDAPYTAAAAHVRAQLDAAGSAEVERRTAELRSLQDAADGPVPPG